MLTRVTVMGSGELSHRRAGQFFSGGGAETCLPKKYFDSARKNRSIYQIQRSETVYTVDDSFILNYFARLTSHTIQ